jgi:hypothetical protein
MILQNVLVEQTLEPGKRVTVAMGTNRDLTTGKPFISWVTKYDCVDTSLSIPFPMYEEFVHVLSNLDNPHKGYSYFLSIYIW